MYKLYDFRYKMAAMIRLAFFVLTLITTTACHNVTSGGSCRNVVYHVQNLIQQVKIVFIWMYLISCSFTVHNQLQTYFADTTQLSKCVIGT